MAFGSRGSSSASSGATRSVHMNLLINLDVDDLEKAVHFYSSVFGLRVGRSFGAFGVEMVGSSAPIYLLVKAPGTPALPTVSQRRSYERHWTGPARPHG